MRAKAVVDSCRWSTSPRPCLALRPTCCVFILPSPWAPSSTVPSAPGWGMMAFDGRALECLGGDRGRGWELARELERFHQVKLHQWQHGSTVLSGVKHSKPPLFTGCFQIFDLCTWCFYFNNIWLDPEPLSFQAVSAQRGVALSPFWSICPPRRLSNAVRK